MKSFIYLWAFILLLLCGCAHSGKTTAGHSYPLSFKNICQGLPADGLWRQHIALHDMNADGFLDIVAPPARKSVGKFNRPSIFMFNTGDNIWKEGAYDIPLHEGYGYGGIAVADLDNDGRPDIVLAVHTGRIIILKNSGEDSFTTMPFECDRPFSSRAVAIDDVNGDGWNDIIAFAEVFSGSKKDRSRVGLLLGMNMSGSDWEVRTVEPTRGGISGDSVATGDLNGNGYKDIIIAPLTNVNENKKVVWFNDGKGNFAPYGGDIAGDLHTSVVRAGDINGDGKDEIIIIMTGPELTPPFYVYAFMWDGLAFVQTPSQMEFREMPSAIDIVDIDGDNRKEVIVLYKGGIDILKYTEPGWSKIGHQELTAKESIGVYDLRAGVNSDGTVLVVYNLGNEPNPKVWNNGLRAYLVKPAGRE